jgi:hypothetical protein
MMTLTALPRVAAMAVILTVSVASSANAQTAGVDPHHPSVTQPLPGSPVAAGQGQPQQPGSGPTSPGMMGQGMMGRMMQPGMMAQSGMMPGAMGAPLMGMRGHAMKLMFAIADTDGDNSLSFEEITAVHKRIFNKIDANKDGKVTPEEVQTFMRE